MGKQLDSVMEKATENSWKAYPCGVAKDMAKEVGAGFMGMVF